MLTQLEEHQIRFERAIYLYYVEINQDKQFKKVSKDEFFNVEGFCFDTFKDFEFDKNNIYRLADCRTVWYNKSGGIVGESWYEGNLASYWIKII